MAESVRWRVDASTSRTVRILWAVGTGTLLAAVVLVAFVRLLSLTVAAGWTTAGNALLAVLVAVAATVLALAVAGDAGARLAAVRRIVPGLSAAEGGSATAGENESGPGLRRALDAAVAAVVVGAYLVAMVFGVGGPPGNGLAAVTLPLALVAIVLAVALRSAGAIDSDERTLYLADPAEEVDLDLVADVSTRRIGDGALVSLEYTQPDGQYVPGPRWLFVPAEVGREIERLVAREAGRAER